MAPGKRGHNAPAARRVIGLLGGTFNPAHEGHLQLSLYALRKLKLDEVWWLVTPQNPLKDKSAAFKERFASAEKITKGVPRIIVSDIEKKLRTHYTVDTLEALIKRHPDVQFIWMMGADNLMQFDKWRGWRRIADMLPIAVFDRAPYAHKAQRGKAYAALMPFSIKTNQIKREWRIPSIAFLRMPRNTISSTALRKSLEKRVI